MAFFSWGDVMSSVHYDVAVNRDTEELLISIDYFIDAYIDPETDEFFPDTSWFASADSVFESGSSVESDTPIISVPLAQGEIIDDQVFTFSAENNFSGDSVGFQTRLLMAAFANSALSVLGTANKDIIVTGSGEDVIVAREGTDFIFAGDGADLLDGGKGNDVLDGEGGDDILIGGAGQNMLHGGAGTDTASYASAASGVTVNLAQAGYQDTVGAGVDSLSDIENLKGSSFEDTLTGDGGDNTLYGRGGNDLLNGGSGDDVLNGGGGTGTDMASYAGAAAGVTVNLGVTGRQQTIGAGADTLVDIENLKGSSFDDTLTGDGGANSLYGRGGDDVLNGGSGNDTLDGGGGAGSDTASYADATAGVKVNLTRGRQGTVGAGIDTLIDIENLKGSSHEDTLIGNTGANVLDGDKGGDALNGGDGNDTLIGGAGRDTMTGGSGKDIFAFRSVTDSVKTIALRDTIADFVKGSDKIDLAAIDANVGVAGDQAFNFIGAAAFSGIAGELRAVAHSGETVVSGDVNGDGAADFAINLIGAFALAQADFDDQSVSISPLSASKAEGNIGTTSFTFTVSRAGDASSSESVKWAVTGRGTNPADADDFGGALPSDTVTFAAGQTSKTITVFVSGDTDVEPDERFTVTLSHPSTGLTIATDKVGGIIRNDDEEQSVSISALSAAKLEGNSGTTSFTFTVSRTGDVSTSENVKWAVTGSGTSPADVSDFGGAFPSNTVTFAAGETSKTITVGVSGDAQVESNEDFTITLSDPSAGLTIATGEASGVIQNDDLPSFWTVDSMDDGISSFSPHGTTAGGKSIIDFNVDFNSLDPLAFHVAQGSSTSELKVAFSPTVTNDTGVDWTGFSINYVDDLPSNDTAEVAHTFFAHFHDSNATFPGWGNPDTGFNKVTRLEPSVLNTDNINGAHGIKLSDGIFGAGVTDPWFNINLHQFPQSDPSSSLQGGGAFTVILTPIL